MAYLGCPHCKNINEANATTISLICRDCGEYFRKEDGEEFTPEQLEKSYGLVKSGAVLWRHRFRDSLAKQADDQKNGTLRGANWYNYRQMNRYEKRTGNTRGVK